MLRQPLRARVHAHMHASPTNKLCHHRALQETLNFMQFMVALKHVAAALRVSLNEVCEAIVLIQAPLADS